MQRKIRCAIGVLWLLLSVRAAGLEIPCAHGPNETLFLPDAAADKANGLPGLPKAVEPINPDDYHEILDAGFNLSVTCYFKDAEGSGFRDFTLGSARRERLFDAFRYLASVFGATSNRQLYIVVNPSEQSGESGVPIAFCGPVLVPQSGQLIPLARFRLVNGAAPSGFETYPDMLLTVNWGVSWHIEATPPPADQLDLMSVLIHELTHGLGFNASITVATPSGLGVFTPFDRLLGRGDATPLINGLSEYTGSPADLVSDGLIFLGSESAAAYGEALPIYAPNPYLQGTSLQHWDPYRLTDTDVVMAPSYVVGSARRQYAPFEVAALRDLGYAAGGESVLPNCPVVGIELLEPRENPRITSGDRVAVTLTAQPLYADGSCALVTATTEVSYYLDGVFQGKSSQEVLRFPVVAQVTAGSHTLQAVAVETAGGSTAETTVTFTAVYDPGENALTLDPGDPVQDFGRVRAGKTASRTIQLRNSGSVPAGVSVTLEGDSVFTLSEPVSGTVLPGQATVITVRFSPIAKNSAYQGTLRINTDHGQLFTVALSGKGGSAGLFQCGMDGSGRACGGNSMGDLITLVAAMSFVWMGTVWNRRRNTRYPRKM